MPYAGSTSAYEEASPVKTASPIKAVSVPEQSGSGYPEPFNTRVGSATWRPLGDQFDLTQFGVNLETLKPGDQSALRHWHTLSDEFVYVLAGEVVLVTDEGESALVEGMCAGFKAGERNAHHFINRGSASAQLLVMGARVPGDNAFYPDDDIVWFHTHKGRVAARKDGKVYT
jgi:uncharacterized cupin superfamily protein